MLTVPQDGSSVRNGDTNHKTETCGQHIGNSGTKSRLGGHTALLKVDCRQVAKPENENGRPVPLQQHQVINEQKKCDFIWIMGKLTRIELGKGESASASNICREKERSSPNG
jgi:hypothetical protein